MNNKWKREILKKLGNRDNIGFDGVYDTYFKKDNLPYQDVRDCFELLESEFRISSGLLRPDDALDMFFQTTPTLNPLRWLLDRGLSEDIQSELLYQLNKRATDRKEKIETVGEFVRVWCGKKAK